MTSSWLSITGYDLLEGLAASGDTVLLAAFENLLMDGDREEFWDTVCHLVRRRTDGTMVVESQAALRFECVDYFVDSFLLSHTEAEILHWMIEWSVPSVLDILSDFSHNDLTETETAIALKDLANMWQTHEEYSVEVAIINHLQRDRHLLLASEADLLKGLLLKGEPRVYSHFDSFYNRSQTAHGIDVSLLCEGLCEVLEDDLDTNMVTLQSEAMALLTYLKEEMFIPEVQHVYLKDLIEALDPILFASLSLLQDVEDSTSKHLHTHIPLSTMRKAHAEALDTCQRIAAGWRETVDPVFRDVLNLVTVLALGDITERKRIHPSLGTLRLSPNDVDLVHLLVYDSDDDLLDAYERYRDSGFEPNGFLELAPLLYRSRISEAEEYISMIRRVGYIGEVSHQYLSHCLRSLDEDLLEAFSEYDNSMDQEELLHSMQELADGWRDICPHTSGLHHIDWMLKYGIIQPETFFKLEELIAGEDEVLLAAFALYDDSQDTQTTPDSKGSQKVDWHQKRELFDTITHILRSRGIPCEIETQAQQWHRYFSSLFESNLLPRSDFEHLEGEFDRNNVALGAILAEYQQQSSATLRAAPASVIHTSNENKESGSHKGQTELIESIQSFAASWRRYSPNADVLLIIGELYEAKSLVSVEVELLEYGVFSNEENLSALISRSRRTLPQGTYLHLGTEESLTELLSGLSVYLEHYLKKATQSYGDWGRRCVELLSSRDLIRGPDLKYINALVEKQDLTLFAALATFFEVAVGKDPIDVREDDSHDVAEARMDLFHTLISLARRWRRTCGSEKRELLSLLEYLGKKKTLRPASKEALEEMVLDGNMLLLSCHATYLFRKKNAKTKQEKADVWKALLSGIANALNVFRMHRDSSLSLLASRFISTLISRKQSGTLITPFTAAGLRYLQRLAQTATQGKGSNPKLLSTFATYKSTGDVDTLLDNLLDLSQGWLTDCTQIQHQVLTSVEALRARLELSPDVVEEIELEVYSGDTTLIDMFTKCSEAANAWENSPNGAPFYLWDPFLDAVNRVKARVTNVQFIPRMSSFLLITVEEMRSIQGLSITEAAFVQSVVEGTLSAEWKPISDEARARLWEAYQVFGLTHSQEDLRSSLFEISSLWRQGVGYPDLLMFLYQVGSSRLLSSVEWDFLEYLVFTRDSGLEQAYLHSLSLVSDTPSDAVRSLLAKLFQILDKNFHSHCLELQPLAVSLIGHLKELRFIPEADFRYLSLLSDIKDPVLYGAITESDACPAGLGFTPLSEHLLSADPHALASDTELVETLSSLGSRWRRDRGPFVTDLLTTVSFLREEKLITFTEFETLDTLVYQNDADLFALFEVFEFDGYSAFPSFLSGVRGRLDRVFTRIDERRMSLALSTFDTAMQLVESQSDFSSLHKLYLRELLQQRDEVLLACLYDFYRYKDASNLFENLLHLARRWRRRLLPSSLRAHLLTVLSHLEDEQQIPQMAVDVLEVLVYNKNEELLSCFASFLLSEKTAQEGEERKNPGDDNGDNGDSGDVEYSWVDFWDDLCYIVRRECDIHLVTFHDLLLNTVDSLESDIGSHLRTGIPDSAHISGADGLHLRQRVADFDPRVMAALNTFHRTQDLGTLCSLLCAVGRSWRQDKSKRALLDLVSILTKAGMLVDREREIVEVLVYKEDDRIFAAFSLFLETKDLPPPHYLEKYTMEQVTSMAVAEFVDTLHRLLDRNFVRHSEEVQESAQDLLVQFKIEMHRKDPSLLADSNFSYLCDLLKAHDPTLLAILSMVPYCAPPKYGGVQVDEDEDGDDVIDLELDRNGVQRNEGRESVTKCKKPSLAQHRRSRSKSRICTVDMYTEEEADEEEAVLTEVYDSLLRLSDRWRSVCAPVQSSALQLLADLYRRRIITLWDTRTLDSLVYHRDPSLLAAFLAWQRDGFYCHSVQKEQRKPTQRNRSPHGSSSRLYDWEDLWKILKTLIRRESSMKRRVHAHTASIFLKKIEARHAAEIRRYHVLRAQLKEKKESGNKKRRNSLPITPDKPPFSVSGIAHLKQLGALGDPSLLRLMANFEVTHDVEELSDAASVLSESWKQQLDTCSSEFIGMIDFLQVQGHLRIEVCEALEYLVFLRNPPVLAAYSIYHDSPQSAADFSELWDTLCRVLRLAGWTGYKVSPHVTIPAFMDQSVRLRRYVDHMFKKRQLTTTEWQYVCSLLSSSEGSIVIEAAFVEFLSKPTDPASKQDLCDTIQRVGRSWRRSHSVPHLLAYLHQLARPRGSSPPILTYEQWDRLDWMAFQNNPLLLSVWKRALFGISSKQVSRAEAAADVFSQVASVLHRDYLRTCHNLHGVGHVTIDHMFQSPEEYPLPVADYLYLLQLLQYDEPRTTYNTLRASPRMLQEDGSSSPLSRLRSKDPFPDEVLYAAIATFADDHDTNELVETLTALGRRWRRLVSSDVSEFLSAVENLARYSYLLHCEVEQLEVMALLENPQVLRLSSMVAQCDNTSRMAASTWIEDVSDLLEAEIYERWVVHVEQAMDFLRLMDEKDLLSQACIHYIQSVLENCASTQTMDVVLMAAFAEYTDSHDKVELIDTLVRLSARWRKDRDASQQKLLQLIDVLASRGSIPTVIHERLEWLVYDESVPLLVAYELYMESGYSKLGWWEFWDTLTSIVDRDESLAAVGGLGAVHKEHESHAAEGVLNEEEDDTSSMWGYVDSYLSGSEYTDFDTLTVSSADTGYTDDSTFTDATSSAHITVNIPSSPPMSIASTTPISDTSPPEDPWAMPETRKRSSSVPISQPKRKSVSASATPTNAAVRKSRRRTRSVTTNEREMGDGDVSTANAILSPTMARSASGDDILLSSPGDMFGGDRVSWDANRLESREDLPSSSLTPGEEVNELPENMAEDSVTASVNSKKRGTPRPVRSSLKKSGSQSSLMLNPAATSPLGILSHGISARMEPFARCIDWLRTLNNGHVLSHTGGEYLNRLLVEGDLVLEVSLLTMRDGGDVVEFLDTLVRLSGRWRRELMREDPMMRRLLRYLNGLLRQRFVTFAEWDFLEGRVYLKEPYVIGLFQSLYDEAEQGATDTELAARCLFQGISSLLDEQVDSVCQKLRLDAESFLLKLRNRMLLPSADHAYLQQLVHENNEVLFAAFSLSAQTQDREDLIDTLVRLSQRWARAPYACPDAVSLISILETLHVSRKGPFRTTDIEWIHLLLSLQSRLVLSASRAYMQERGRPGAKEQLVFALEDALSRYLDLSYQYYSDGLLSCVRVLYQHGVLLSADCEHISILLKQEDPVLMACFCEYSESQNLDELIDTFVRIAHSWRKAKDVEALVMLMTYLHSRGHIPSQLADTLSRVIFYRDSVLLAAMDEYRYRVSTNPHAAWKQLWNTIVSFTDRMLSSANAEYRSTVMRTANELLDRGVMCQADLRHIKSLVQRNDITLSSSVASAMVTKSKQELCDTIASISRQWRTTVDRRLFLLLKNAIPKEMATPAVLDDLFMLLFEHDDRLFAAFHEARLSDFSREYTERFRDVVLAIILELQQKKTASKKVWTP